MMSLPLPKTCRGKKKSNHSGLSVLMFYPFTGKQSYGHESKEVISAIQEAALKHIKTSFKRFNTREVIFILRPPTQKRTKENWAQL